MKADSRPVSWPIFLLLMFCFYFLPKKLHCAILNWKQECFSLKILTGSLGTFVQRQADTTAATCYFTSVTFFFLFQMLHSGTAGPISTRWIICTHRGWNEVSTSSPALAVSRAALTRTLCDEELVSMTTTPSAVSRDNWSHVARGEPVKVK